jgi:hypothetical protein
MGIMQPIENGSVVFCQGFEFQASEVTERIVPVNGQRIKVRYYKGICTASKRNDSIRHTGYNGGRYSQYLGTVDWES